ncbi:uncharacterized protein BO80DRAFT_259278 [Aspergillus ibericus CBS 121593]|uniref:Uncharacterized protein n=1 Tax=Aspergillus ibericus CBS 121593 TaxID=1448316 RepID=A0A395H8L3_9EURO|nr:hypothetical protein BO80DRAFT_259278 [Aspergillus ibericus CBS 121593]RAL04247.1 hypothetical protein BO80DRAFT_259278 [Aspergillus ibericus CBS 121593]
MAILLWWLDHAALRDLRPALRLVLHAPVSVAGAARQTPRPESGRLGRSSSRWACPLSFPPHKVLHFMEIDRHIGYHSTGDTYSLEFNSARIVSDAAIVSLGGSFSEP